MLAAGVVGVVPRVPWGRIQATRRAGIPAQMRFYSDTVPVYYTWRNASHQAVRAEKNKVFGAARRVVITTDAPAMELSAQARTAITRFRKRYIIEGAADPPSGRGAPGAALVSNECRLADRRRARRKGAALSLSAPGSVVSPRP